MKAGFEMPGYGLSHGDGAIVGYSERLTLITGQIDVGSNSPGTGPGTSSAPLRLLLLALTRMELDFPQFGFHLPWHIDQRMDAKQVRLPSAMKKETYGQALAQSIPGGCAG